MKKIPTQDKVRIVIYSILLLFAIYILYLLFRSLPIDPEITLPVQEEPAVVTTGVVDTTVPPICEVDHYEIIPQFKQNFIDKRQYEDSKNYCFGTYIKGYGYLNTYRNKYDGVSNDSKHNLDGCKSGYDIMYKGSFPLRLYPGEKHTFAQDQGIYGYTHKTIPDYFILTEDMLRSSPTKDARPEQIMEYYIYPVYHNSECQQ